MKRRTLLHFTALALCAVVPRVAGLAQVVQVAPVDKWVVVTAAAGGTDEKAADEAAAQAACSALREAVRVGGEAPKPVSAIIDWIGDP